MMYAAAILLCSIHKDEIGSIHDESGMQMCSGERPRLHEGSSLLLRFLNRSLELEANKALPAVPGFHLAFEAYIGILEIASILGIFGLAGTAFLPEIYARIQVIPGYLLETLSMISSVWLQTGWNPFCFPPGLVTCWRSGYL